MFRMGNNRFMKPFEQLIEKMAIDKYQLKQECEQYKAEREVAIQNSEAKDATIAKLRRELEEEVKKSSVITSAIKVNGTLMVIGINGVTFVREESLDEVVAKRLEQWGGAK